MSKEIIMILRFYVYYNKKFRGKHVSDRWIKERSLYADLMRAVTAQRVKDAQKV